MNTPVGTHEFSFKHNGMCLICEKEVEFRADGPYFRNTLRCPRCNSLPRSLALMHVLSQFFPNWKDYKIHESSPGWDRLSRRLLEECEEYTGTQYDSSVPLGSVVEAVGMAQPTYRSENLECQTFPDSWFHLVITQDVFEHIFRPDLAIKEIARTLKPGGATLMTVPITRKLNPSRRRARLVGGEVQNLLAPEFHGNPLTKNGSLVTIDWGYDIVSYLQKHSGLSFIMLQIDDIDRGIRADLNEILVGFKIPVVNLE